MLSVDELPPYIKIIGQDIPRQYVKLETKFGTLTRGFFKRYVSPIR